MTTASTRAMTPIERMNDSSAERANAPISRAELERRWQGVRDAMEEAGVDALFVHSHTIGVGGATRWFADRYTPDGYPTSLVFSRSEPMTLIAHGPLDGDRRVSPDDPATPGIHRVLSTASFSSASYCQHYDADLALTALHGLRPAKVGIVAPSQIPYPMLDRIQKEVGVECVDFSEAVDAVKSVKSPEEQRIVRATAALQDATLEYGLSIIEPGMRDADVGIAMQQFASTRGSEHGQYMVGSAPIGEPAMFQLRHTQQRVIREGDAITLNVEISGPGGYWAHVGRNAVLGTAPQQLKDEFATALAAQQATVDMLRAGTPSRDVFAAYQEFLRGEGLPPERRVFCHGQGYDVVERPLIRDDEPMVLRAGMNIGCHPMWVRDEVCAFTNDNYLVQADGPAERIHTFPQHLVEIG